MRSGRVQVGDRRQPSGGRRREPSTGAEAAPRAAPMRPGSRRRVNENPSGGMTGRIGASASAARASRLCPRAPRRAASGDVPVDRVRAPHAAGRPVQRPNRSRCLTPAQFPTAHELGGRAPRVSRTSYPPGDHSTGVTGSARLDGGLAHAFRVGVGFPCPNVRAWGRHHSRHRRPGPGLSVLHIGMLPGDVVGPSWTDRPTTIPAKVKPLRHPRIALLSRNWTQALYVEIPVVDRRCRDLHTRSSLATPRREPDDPDL